jgi:hypothetical protein
MKAEVQIMMCTSDANHEGLGCFSQAGTGEEMSYSMYILCMWLWRTQSQRSHRTLRRHYSNTDLRPEIIMECLVVEDQWGALMISHTVDPEKTAMYGRTHSLCDELKVVL